MNKGYKGKMSTDYHEMKTSNTRARHKWLSKEVFVSERESSGASAAFMRSGTLLPIKYRINNNAALGCCSNNAGKNVLRLLKGDFGAATFWNLHIDICCLLAENSPSGPGVNGNGIDLFSVKRWSAAVSLSRIWDGCSRTDRDICQICRSHVFSSGVFLCRKQAPGNL